ncbi:hypothetical protein BaRGS_00003256 [Batillaria attramentaria]|uniref:Uncharacterized protein n=1 Tax=Batillaria attramentaria TaxID=370345 RepID=A0ABD0M191_9CAEN
MLCVKTGIPGVNNAVQKLEELAGRMISGHFGFRTNDVDNIDMVIDALYQLESERKKMHESLETESITAFRYQSGMSDVIARTEGEIWGSLTDVLQTTRAANARKRQEVEETLARKLENLAELEDSSLELDEENALLREMSILSELKREERDVHEHMMEQEENIIRIQNEMIQARQTARQEKAAMLQEIEVLKEEAEQQHKQNRVEKRKLEAMKAQLANSYSQLQDMKRSMAELEQRQVALEKEEKTKEAYFTRLEAEIESVTEETAGLEKTNEAWQSVFAEKHKIQTDDARKLDEAQGALTLVQEALDKATDEIARMETENMEMEDEISSTADCHTATVNWLNQQVQVGRKQLVEEKKLDRHLPEEARKARTSLTEVILEEKGIIREKRKSIQMERRRYSQLASEGARLMQEIADDDRRIRRLKQQIKEALYCPEVTVLENKVTTMMLIEESKAKMIQQERTMVENKDTKAYFAHTKEQEAFVDDDTDPMWWGVDKDTLDELKELQQLEDSKPAGLAQTVAGVDMIMGMRPAETKEFMKITKLPVAARPSKSEVAHTKTRKPAVKKVKRAKSQEPAKVTQPIVKPTDSQEEALRMVTLAQAEREECKMLEATVEAKRQELKEKLPFVQELQKRFEELTTGFLEIQVAPEKVKGLQAEITKVKAELAEAREPLKSGVGKARLFRPPSRTSRTIGHPCQAFLREENKAKRASYLHQLENNGDVIKTKEKAIFSVTCKIRAIMEANEKFENRLKDLEKSFEDLQIRTDENRELIDIILPAKLAKLREEMATLIGADFKMLQDFVLKSEATAAEFDRFKIDEAEMEAKAKILDPIVDALQSESAILKDHLRRLLPRPPSGNYELRTTNKLLRDRGRSDTKKGGPNKSKKLEQSKSKKGGPSKAVKYRRRSTPPSHVSFVDVEPMSSSSDDTQPKPSGD